MRGPGGLWLATVIALALAAAVSFATPAVANAQLSAALGHALGTSEIRVRVSAWPSPALWWGRVDVLVVAARHLRMGTVNVDAFDATFTHVRVDPASLYANRPLTIRSPGTGVASATVTQEALAALLNQQPSVRNASVTLEGGRVSVDGTVTVLGASMHATGDGHLVVRGGTAVDLVLDRVSVGGLLLGGGLAEEVTRSINPLLDLRVLPFGLRLSGVTVADGKATLDAVTIQ